MSELRTRLKKSYFVNFEREIFFLLIKIIDLDESLITMIKTEKKDKMRILCSELTSMM